MGIGRDVDDPRGRRRPDDVEESKREREVTEVVDRHRELVAVDRLGATQAVHAPGVVDEHVEFVETFPEFVGRTRHRIE